MSDYPLGAENDSSAPYNETETEVDVIVTINFKHYISHPKDVELEIDRVNSLVSEYVKEQLNKTDFEINSLDVSNL